MQARPESSFAAVLRRLRESRSLTQEELADRAGLTVKAVGALERGERRRPYPHTVRSLADGLGLDDVERAALVASVPRRGQPPTDPAPAAPAQRAPQATAPLTAATPFIGREADVATVEELLTAGHRLVTLTGPGGVGKTRLAVEVLSRRQRDVAEIRAIVDLSAVRDPSTVLPRLAAALGVPEGVAGTSAAELAPFLAGRRALVLVDNLEQLLASGTVLADLVARCPDLTVLATSRAPLRVRSERELKIAPLALPPDDSATAVAGSAAVTLFLDRAQAAGSALRVTPDNAAAVAEVCRRLAGLPLAIELVAARAGLLGPAAILDRLQRGSLGEGPRDLPDRQRTMAATVDWSHALLEPDQQRLLATLAVFAEGFSLDAAEAVAERDVVDDLASLVDHSLVMGSQSPDDQPRFRLLEPVRQYAVGRLRQSGHATRTADRHAAFVHRSGVDAGTDLRGSLLVAALDRLETAHADLRSGFLRLVEAGRPDEAAELVERVWLYLALRGHAREGLDWLSRLDQAEPGDRGRCAALTGSAALLFATGDIATMLTTSRAAVALARRVAEPGLLAEAAVLAGHAALFTGDLTEAGSVLDEALRTATAAGDRWGAGHALLGQGQLALVRGELDAADELLRGSEQHGRAIGNSFTLASALTRRATVTALRGDHASSAELLAESTGLSLAARIGWTLSYSLPALAGVAVQLHEEESAAVLFGASASLSAAHAVDPRFPVSSDLSQRDLVAARARLGDEAFRRSWDAGRLATTEEIADLVRRLRTRARG